MAFFVRNEQPRRWSDHRLYKPFLRRDFRRQRAYCERSEGYLRQAAAFGVDHFKPKSLFPALVCDYANLYYCCNRCNWSKSDRWPSQQEVDAGVRFADPCESDPYVDHFAEQPDGRLNPLTPCGAFTITHLRLNAPECVEFRLARARLSRDVDRIRAELTSYEARAGAEESRIVQVICGIS